MNVLCVLFVVCTQVELAEGFLLLDFLNNFLRQFLGKGSEVGQCDGCFCIPDSGVSCPVDMKPDVDAALVPVFQSFLWDNPYSLDCDPYAGGDCDTTPPLVEGGACVVNFEDEETDACASSYTVQTFEGTLETAIAENLYVTHAGPCGACSSLQDLAVYIETGPNLRELATSCGFQSRLSRSLGVSCFQGLGFTEGCATVWFYNARETADSCLFQCLLFALFGRSPNGAAPLCELVPCIQCDEENAGPLFQIFAGRTRRNSGLLSNIVRSCSELAGVTQQNPCS